MPHLSMCISAKMRQFAFLCIWQNAELKIVGFCLCLGGACGYGNLYREGYSTDTTALSTVLFNAGATCGACFEIQCIHNPEWCLPGHPSVIVTATNLCPPNFALSGDNGGWCNPPRKHFDMAEPAFLKLARYKGGIVPIKYRRVTCEKEGGIRFTVHGNPYFNLVLVTNVGGSGDVVAMEMKGSRTGWIPMTRNWGQNWQCNVVFTGQELSFRVTAGDHRVLTSLDVAPANWHFGQTFEAQNQYTVT